MSAPVTTSAATPVDPASRFRPLPAEQSPDALERELLERWREERLFARTVEQRAGGTPWIFYEGPPTANNVPHVGHVVTRVVKDLFPRFRTMLGHHVPRKGGWDTHGLPVEIEVEKQLGISGKQDIEASAWRASTSSRARASSATGATGSG